MEQVEFKNDIKVGIIKASSFPSGVLAAHKKLHSIIPFSRERQYYGISYGSENGEITYLAAAQAFSDTEMDDFGLESFTIKKGNYIIKHLKNYRENMSIIGSTFQEMLQHPQLDPQGYCLEAYTNENDMDCLVKIL